MATVLTKRKKDSSKPIPTNNVRVILDFPAEIELSPRDSKQFLRHLSHPPKPNQKLKEAVARFKKRIGENA